MEILLKIKSKQWLTLAFRIENWMLFYTLSYLGNWNKKEMAARKCEKFLMQRYKIQLSRAFRKNTHWEMNFVDEQSLD